MVTLRKVGAVALLLCTFSNLKTQRMVAGSGGPRFTMTWFNMEDLNSRFKENGIERIPMPQRYFGGGGSGIVGGIILGGWGFNGEGILNGDSVDVRISYGGGYFQPGYILPLPKNPNIGIVLGIGSYSSILDFIPQSLEDIPFDTLLTDEGAKRISRVTGDGLSLAIGAQINLFLKKGFFFIGPSVEGGYIFSKPSWKLWDGKGLVNFPKPKPTGPYLSLSLLFGGGF